MMRLHPSQLVAAPFQKQVICDGCNLIIYQNYYKVQKSNLSIDYCSLKCCETHHETILNKVLDGDLSMPATGDMDPTPKMH